MIEANKILKRQLIVMTGQVLILLLCLKNTLSIIDLEDRHQYIKESTFYSEVPPLKKLCFFAFASILNKSSDIDLFHQELIEQLREESFESFDLNGMEKIYHISEHDNNRCKVLVEDDNGVRSFVLTWSKSAQKNSYFGYVITKIYELTIYDLEKEVSGL